MRRGAEDHLLPSKEASRLEALHSLEILDTRREERFDRLIEELARKLDAPIAYLALIDENRQWLKSKVGPIPPETRREDAFCSHTILEDRPLLVPDASKDPRFAEGPLVQQAPHLRFYAGIPVSDSSGHTLGTVCVAGPTPRQIEPRELAILEGFADRLKEELETRPRVLVIYATEDAEAIARFLDCDPRLRDPAVLELWSTRRGNSSESGDWQLEDALSRAKSAVLMVSPALLASPLLEEPPLRRRLRAREADGLETRVVRLAPGVAEDRASRLAQQPGWPAGGRAIMSRSESEIDASFRELAIELLGPPEHPEPVLFPTESTGTSGAGAGEAERVRVFLSHAGEDAAAVKDLADRLRQAGLEVWLDVDELRPGDDWMESLEAALDDSHAFAVYIGRSGIARWIGREVRVALDRNAKDPRYRFIPILGPGSEPDALPRFVAQHHWLDLREGDPQPAEIRKLVGSLLSRPAEAVALLPPGEPPFRGLLTFDSDHSHLFFGRDRETAELVQRLQASAFLAVIGDSGSGKSSLIRAGLVPALHRGHFRDQTGTSAAWRIAVIKPGSAPFRELTSGLVDLLPEASATDRLATLEACSRQLAEGTGGLSAALSALVPKGERTLLVIDQFEEVFTQCPDPDERDRFIDTLLDASHCEGDRPFHTIVTLRADFYSRCFEHPTLPSVLSTCQYAVRAIATDKLAEVIEKPAMLAGIRLEPGLAEAILFDLGAGPGNLPLLEHTLLQLWKLRTGETLTHASYEEIGRVQGALEHHAEEVFGRFDAREQQVAKKLLLGLVTPTESAGPARRRVRTSELLPAGDLRSAAERVLASLVDERLLIVRGGDDNAQGEATPDSDSSEVEVTHEALLRGWRRLGAWLEEDREFLFWRQRVNAAFETWKQSGRDAGALLRGAPLAEAARWQRTRGEDLSEEGAQFIEASLGLQRRHQRNRTAAMALIAGIAAVAVGLWFNASRARDAAERSLELATQAVDDMLTEVGSEALKDVPQLEDVRQKLLAEAKALYEELSRQSSSGAHLRLQTALAPARMAMIRKQMGEGEAAREGLSSAIESVEALTGTDPSNPSYRSELAKLHNEMGWLLTDSMGAAEPSEAAASYHRAIAIQEDLRDGHPEEVEYSYELGQSHLNRGILRLQQGELEGAEADFEAAIASVAPFRAESGPWRDQIGQHLARGHNQLANVYSRRRQYAQAQGQYEIAARLFEGLVANRPESREYNLELAMIHQNLVDVTLKQPENRDLERAAEDAREAVELLAGLATALPHIREELAKAHRAAGLVQREQKRSGEAAESLLAASRLFAQLIEDGPEPRQDDYRHNEAVTLLFLGRLRFDARELTELRKVRARLDQVLSELPKDNAARIRSHPDYRRINDQG